jgi:CHASE3 domain sensor protein
MKSRLKLSNIIIAAAGAALFMLMGLTGFAGFEVDQHYKDITWVKHTYTVLDHLEGIRLEIKNAEIGRRIFMLTGSTKTLAGVQLSAESVRRSAEVLQKLTSDNPSQAARAENLATTAADIRASIEARFHRGSHTEGAAAFVRAENLAQTMENEERLLLIGRTINEAHSARLSLMWLACAVLFAVMIGGMTLILILKNLYEHETLIAELKRANGDCIPRNI